MSIGYSNSPPSALASLRNSSAPGSGMRTDVTDEINASSENMLPTDDADHTDLKRDLQGPD